MVRLPVSIIDFKPFHTKLFDPEQEAFSSFTGFGADPEQFIIAASQSSCRVCSFIDAEGMVLGIAGAFPQFFGIGGGSARLFLVPSRHVKEQCPLAFARAARKMAESLVRQWGLHRLEAVALDGFTTGARFLAFLGFRAVGVLEKYDLDGRDFVLYEKIYSEEE